MTFRIERLQLQQKEVRSFAFNGTAYRDSIHHRNACWGFKGSHPEEESPEHNGGIREKAFSGTLYSPAWEGLHP